MEYLPFKVYFVMRDGTGYIFSVTLPIIFIIMTMTIIIIITGMSWDMKSVV